MFRKDEKPLETHYNPLHNSALQEIGVKESELFGKSSVRATFKHFRKHIEACQKNKTQKQQLHINHSPESIGTAFTFKKGGGNKDGLMWWKL